jgi:hypothetical protein
MLKSVRLKLAKIKYSGDSVGDDIRVEIKMLEKILHVDKRIKAGTTAEINKEIGIFETDRGLFQADVFITVIDKDILFNDVGKTQNGIKINTAIANPQQFVFEAEVKETRSKSGKIWGTKIGVFEITLEASVIDAILHVSLERTKYGWIWARKEDDKTKINLPAYLKVKIESQNAKRQYFTILEGAWRGTKASIEIRKDGISYLESINNQIGSVHLFYSRSRKTLKFKNKTYIARGYKDDPEPWKKTLYKIEIPDYFHEGGRYYLDKAKLAPVWFKTAHPSGNRYVHPGTYSLGCVTLTEIERWDELCKILLRARKGDDESIGVLEVVD